MGRHIAQAAVDSGHEVTLFHRGRIGADLFSQASHLLGDRNSERDLAAIGGGRWDATVDVNAYLPRQVRALDGRGGHQLFISTASVYRAPVAPGFREDAPLIELAEPIVEELTLETYGGLKVACERAVSPPPFGFGQLLAAITARVAPPGTTLTWVGKDYLLASSLDDAAPDGVGLPPEREAQLLAGWASRQPEKVVNPAIHHQRR